ncbi:MAG: hypothetical protein UY50_C0010G0014 [Parcubacteria group bacterium GW2011_GWA2_49_9]|nr:MAG: hypothetical protein UY50_C0010G0014 [Parcubacteria group bacterium GW2011_GWA2_49_9]
MTRSQIQSAWKKVLKETQRVPNWDILTRSSKQYKKVVMLRELLLFCQVLLGRIGEEQNATFNSIIFKKTFNFYRTQIRSYV